MSKGDLALGCCFVAGGVGEAVAQGWPQPSRLVFNVAGALWLALLVLRRRHPVLVICLLAVGGTAGSEVSHLVWPAAPDNGGVWILAMLVAAYSVGAYASGRAVTTGVLMPAAVVSFVDVTTRSGWNRVSGIAFVTVFIGLLPTVAGRLIRVRRARLAVLRDQQAQILAAQRAVRESAALQERLRTVDRLEPVLVDGLRALACASAEGRDAARIEVAARDLLARTREEVVALTTLDVPAVDAEVAPVDHVRTIRQASQRWAALAAAALAAGLSIEATHVLTLMVPAWVAAVASLLVGAPIALAWWRPLVAAVLVWVAAVAYAHVVAPLQGSLSETAVAVASAFMVGCLSRRREAILGLLVCWTGHFTVAPGLGSLGDWVLLGACWFGGLAVQEACRLVEQERANNELLSSQEPMAALRAVVEERLQLARELHDALGHNLTVVALQAGAARRLAHTDPQRAREVMETVTVAAAESAALFDADARGPDFATLVERVRTAGARVEADLTDLTCLDEAQQRVALRTVQEGLTNALRHAPGAVVSVGVRRRGGYVDVAVVNSIPDRPGTGPGTGRGLAGIRDRVLAASGEVTWGPLPAGGFELHARFPVRTEAVLS